MLGIGTKIGTLSKLQVRNKNERTGNGIRKTWNDDQNIKVEKKKTCMCTKNVIHTVHELGTIVNNRNIKQVKNKKKIEITRKGICK